jgi:hypothetical protein
VNKAARGARRPQGGPNLEVQQEGRVGAEYGSPNHVDSNTRLACGLGMDNRRGRWRRVASLDERAVAANQRLVRTVVGHFGVSGSGLAAGKMLGCYGLRLCSACRSDFLFRHGDNCFRARHLIEVLPREPCPAISAPCVCTYYVCTIMMKLAAGPDGRSSKDGRKVRTPQSSVPDNVREGPRASTGGIVRRKVPQKTYRPSRKAQVRVKRCGKSAPPSQ